MKKLLLSIGLLLFSVGLVACDDGNNDYEDEDTDVIVPGEEENDVNVDVEDEETDEEVDETENES